MSLQTALANIDLASSSVNASELVSLAVGEGVHGIEGNVEARGRVVDGEDGDGLAVVLELPAGAAGGRVPALDGLDAADPRVPRDLALGLPAVVGDEAVGAVGAGDAGEGAGAVVVANVVGD